jgi:BMFP domain-containing protein YqiC
MMKTREAIDQLNDRVVALESMVGTVSLPCRVRQLDNRLSDATNRLSKRIAALERPHGHGEIQGYGDRIEYLEEAIGSFRNGLLSRVRELEARLKELELPWKGPGGGKQ